MSDHKKFKNESQDARRHDKHNATHPDEKFDNPRARSDKHHEKHSHEKSDKRK